ncbi:MAG: hypothetical protein NT015_03505 [Alphaproteobacteria bacterium]|nr:hypothetical protein [Alphaproteobacteria bacterium]
MKIFRCLIALVGVFAFATAASVAPPAYAQSDTNARAEYEVRSIANWAREVTAVNTRGVALLQSMESINGAMERFGNGQLNERGLRREINAWRTQFNAEIARLRTDFAALPPPPRLSLLASLQPGLEAVMRRSEQGIDQIETFGTDMVNLFEGVATGDIDSGDAMHQSAMRMLRELLQFENGSLAIMRAMSPPDHPNQSIAGSRTALNDALIVFFDAYLTSMRADRVILSDAQRQTFRDGAVVMRQNNAEGRTVTGRVQADMDLAPHVVSPAMRQATTRMLNSLQETFTTLDRAAALLDNTAALPDGGNVETLDSVLSEVMVIADQLEVQNTERVTVLSGPAAPPL